MIQQLWQRLQFLRQMWSAPSRNGVYIKGHVGVVKRYSDVHPNTKLRGEVQRYYDLGHNLVVNRGRHMSAGLWAGSDGPPPTFSGIQGYNELSGPQEGWVVRGISLGSGSTPEADTDESLETPHINTALGTGGGTDYHEIDAVDFQAYPSTKVIFTRTFGVAEPAATSLDVYEFGLWTAAPDPGILLDKPYATTPPGPSGGPFLVARKTHGLITKSPNFTLQVNWTIEF